MTDTYSETFAKRRIVSLFCLLGILVLLFALLMPVQADAANYKVKQWQDGDLYCYCVYSGTLPKYYEPTFVRTNLDNYYSQDRKIRIAVYHPWGVPTTEQADAFYKYLLSKVSKKSQAGWYSINFHDDNHPYTMTYVFKIEGWSQDSSLYSLLNAGPFWNSENGRLELVDIGHGDQVHEQWRYLRDTLSCTTAIYFRVKDPRDGATVGFRFYDWNGDVDMYSYS